MLNFDKNIYADLSYLGTAEDYLEDILSNLDQISLLQSFDTTELKVLSHYLHCYAAPRGYQLFEQGEAANHCVIVLSGEVTLQLSNVQDTEQETQVLGIGTSLAEASLVEAKACLYTCFTNRPCDLAVISKLALNQILLHSPRLGNKLLLAMMQMMAMKLRHQYTASHQAVDMLIN